MSNETPPKPARKKVPAKTRPTESAASVQALFTQARRYGETAAIVKAISQQIVVQFHAHDRLLPLLLLQRDGEGPRAATTDAIIAAEIALGEVARQFEARARELLGLPATGGKELPGASEELIVDDVVPREDAEAEFKMVAKKTKG